MSKAYRKHSAVFKAQICSDIRSKKLGQREASRLFGISCNLIQYWLHQFDNGEMDALKELTVNLSEHELKVVSLEARIASLLQAHHQAGE